MAEVWKFKLMALDNIVEIPAKARAVSVAFQGDDLCLWAVVDPMRPNAKRTFRVVGTGHAAPDLDGAFVGTAHHPRGLVFHVFDYGDRPAA